MAPHKTRIRVLDLKWENEISYENSVYKKGYTMNNLFFQRIKKHCKPFSNFSLVGTVLIVSHANMISMFSIITQKWVKHFFYASEIWEIFRNHSENHDKSITVLFSDQTVCVIKQQKQENTSEDQEPWVEDPNSRFKIQEKIIDLHQDREDNKFIAFITKKQPGEHKHEDAHHHHQSSHRNSHDLSALGTVVQQDYGLYVLYKNKLYDISDKFSDQFHAKPNLVFLFSINEVTEFVLQHGHFIDLYTLDFVEDKGADDEDEKSEEIGEAEDQKDKV